MEAKWYFSDDLSADKKLVDSFKDSKFSMDRWNSFAREIVQNSIDARDDYTKPVRIVFALNKHLTINDIPGGGTIKDILHRCYDVVSNKQTKGSYAKGLEILNKEYIYCLKISDYNTKGVRTGRDEAWGAFVFDEGKSIKQRPGSAGSHGVGKKVPFIISTCNTVFYSTKNKYIDSDSFEHSDTLFQGKMQLTNWWDDSHTKKCDKGWYGIVNYGASPEERIQPIMNIPSEINPFFVRTDDYGTDVTIVGANIYTDEEEVKRRIISAILYNFFVAIKSGDLEVNVMGVEITNCSFSNVYNKYYIPDDQYGNDLIDCLESYTETPENILISDESGNEIGNVKLFFKLGNSKNKKYYTIVRSHGMKIVDNRVNSADQPYSAVALIEGTELNQRISDLENAAHDKFITDDSDIEISKASIFAYENMIKKIREYIINKTKIDSTTPQNIEELSSIVTVPGSFAVINKRSSKPSIKRNPVRKKTTGKKPTKTVTIETSRDDTKKKRDRKRKRKRLVSGNDVPTTAYENYTISPYFVKSKKGYVLSFQTNDSLENSELSICSVNSDEKIDKSICDYIQCVYINSKRYSIIDGKVSGLSIDKNVIYKVEIVMEQNVMYQLKASIKYKEIINNE